MTCPRCKDLKQKWLDSIRSNKEERDKLQADLDLLAAERDKLQADLDLLAKMTTQIAGESAETTR